MAEADPTELAAFLRTVQGQFQESPGRLAAKLAHICQSLRNSGQEEQPTYRLVASALRTVMIVGKIDPRSLPAGTSMRELTEDGPVFIPDFVQSEAFLRPAWNLPVTPPASFVGASGSLSASQSGAQDLFLHNRLASLQEDLARFTNQFPASMPSGPLNQYKQAGPGLNGRPTREAGSPAAGRDVPKLPEQSSSHLAPFQANQTPAPFGRGDLYMQPEFNTALQFGSDQFLQAQAAALMSQQAFLHGQSKGIPHFRPDLSGGHSQFSNFSPSQQQTPFYGMDGFLQRSSFFQQTAARGHYPPGNQEATPNSGPALHLPRTIPGPLVHSTVPISPHELPRPAPFANEQQSRGLNSSWFPPPPSRPFRPFPQTLGIASSTSAIGSLPGPYPGSHSSSLPSHTAYQIPSQVQQSDQATGERHSNVAPVPHSGSRPSTEPQQQADGESQRTELSRSGPLQSSSQAGQRAFHTGSQKQGVDQSASRLQPVSGNAQTPLASVNASSDAEMRASSVEESVRRGVHQRADAVLASGGDKNAELERVAETVKALAREGQAPACFLAEQKRQLVAQINIFHNFKHGKPANQATIGLALEDLKKLLPKHSGVSKTGGPAGGGVKAPGKRPKRQLTEEQKERAREKERERQRLRKLKKLAEKQPHPLGYGNFWDGAQSAAPSAEAVNLVNTAKEAARRQNAALAAPNAKPASERPSAKPDRLVGQQDNSNLPKNGSSQHEASSIKALSGSASQQSRPAKPSKAPEKSARSKTLKPPAARDPPDTRKPQVIDGWLAAEKATSIAEAGRWSLLHAKLDQHVVSKFVELKHAAALPTQDELKTKNVVELKKLELLAVQKRLRREVMDEFFDPAQAELQNVRQVKLKKSAKRLRELEKREQKQRDERARREKEKIKNSTKSLEQHKAVLTEVQKAKKDRILRNNRLVIEFHKRKERAEREKKERLQREKIQALKSNDVEGYMKLVQDAKSDRVQQLLKETESYLHKLGEKLATVTRQARDAVQGEGLAAAEPPVVETTGAASPSLLESNEKYYTLAHAVKEAVVTQPKMLVGGQLRGYQIKGLQWMVSLYNNKLNGILADEMGLGKTIQVIALLCYLMETKKEAGPFLIVVPSSVFSNWVSEIKRWAPSARTVPYRGVPDTRKRIYSDQMAGGKFDILVTTYEFLMNKHDRPRLSKIKWAHLIIDEGHRIKNANCKLNTDLKQYSAKNRLLLTGTPIQNNLDELWTLLNFLLPDIFNSSDDFRQWFNKPFEGSGVEDTEDQALLNEEENLLVINRLHQVLRPFMLRRMKEKVADELPGKVERLVRCEASTYQKLLARQVTEKLGRLAGQTKGKAVQNTVMELRNICNHPYLSLLHVEDVEFGLDEHFLSTAVRLCGKLEMLDRILPKLKAGGHKILFFCTMTRLLDIMEDYLLEKGYGYLRLDGGTSGADRGSLIEEFNAPDSRAFIFLLSLRAGGIGINLQSADTVIIYDTDWNPQVDLQAQARAHRIGQKKEVLVLRLETVNTVEEKIRARAEHKMGVATQSITAGFFDQSTSAEDRRDFLEAILREANADRAESMDVPDDDQLNELLSRTPEELELFAAEDRRRRQEDEMKWRSIKGSQAVPAVLPRLITEEELQPVLKELERSNLEQSRSGSLDVSEELGRGRRARESRRDGYMDLTERQFNYLLREGNLPPSAVKTQDRENGAEDPQPKKRRKKERKPSEDSNLLEPQLPVARVGEVTAGAGYNIEKPVGEGHLAPASESHLAPPSSAVWQKDGPLRAGTGQDGPGVGSPHIRPQVLPGVAIVRAPAVSSPTAPGVLPISGGCEQSGTDVKQWGDQVPPAQNKRPATASSPAADESDEDLPLCALRPPPPKKPKRLAATSPPSKTPQSAPPPTSAAALALSSPTTGGLSGGVNRQLLVAASGGPIEHVKVPASVNGLSSQLPAQIGGGAPSASNGAPLPRNGPTPPGLSFVDSSLQENVQLLGSGISPGTGLGSMGVEQTQVSKQGGVTETAPAVGLERSDNSGAAMFGTRARGDTARQLGLVGEPKSPPEGIHSSEAFPKSEARDSLAGGQRPLAELWSAANAAPPSSPDSPGVLTGFAKQPPDISKPATVVEQSIDSQEKRFQDLHEAVSKPAGGQVSLADRNQLDALYAPKADPTDESALRSNGLAAEASAALSKPVLRKGLKRRRAHCLTAEEAFEWSEEDVEEPEVRKELVESPSGCPPVAHEADLSSPSGVETLANGLTAGIGGASNGRPLSSARSRAPEVMRVSAEAGGPHDRDTEKQGRFDRESVLLANGIAEVSCNGERGDGNSKGAPNMVRASPTLLQSSVVEQPGGHKAPVTSSPTRSQKAGGFASPRVPSGRAYSLSPGLRVDGGSGSGTPDSVVSEASLRAAHSAVGNLVDAMSVDGVTSCKISYSRAL